MPHNCCCHAQKLKGISTRMVVLAAVSLANSLIAVQSLAGLNVPMYNALKRLATPIVLVAEYLFLGKVAPYEVVAAIALITAGALLAANYDLEFDLKSYTCAIISCILNAANLTMIMSVSTSTSKAKQATTSEILFTNSTLSVLFLLLVRPPS